ncbi:MAG: ADP-ribosylglycohydrolase family protein [Moorellales bacterium]
MEQASSADRILGGLWGVVVGDALGVPVEFVDRERLRRAPVTGMRGYGTHGQPPGTWSDDTSLTLCTLEGLLSGFDLRAIAENFLRWYQEGRWTPWGRVFDVGITTREAIARLAAGVSPEEAGSDAESANGNGSLMRILPVALYFAGAGTEALLDAAHRVSRLTHRHPRSLMACGYYCVLAASLLRGLDFSRACQEAVGQALPYYRQPPYDNELPHFERVFSGRLAGLDEAEIFSDGYVIHTLETAVWCLYQSNSFAEAVLKAVNLGGDTDTTAAVAGGLAGLLYGFGAIPREWLAALARREELEGLFQRFAARLEPATRPAPQ